MSLYNGDIRSYQRLAELKEEALARKAARRAAIGPLPHRPGRRARFAAVLRAAADRLAPAQPTAAESPSPRDRQAGQSA
jgi:hypothetical protein